jgi:hypothetical protein
VDFWHQHTHPSPDSAKALYLTHLQDTPAARPPPRKSAPPKAPFPTRSPKSLPQPTNPVPQKLLTPYPSKTTRATQPPKKHETVLRLPKPAPDCLIELLSPQCA